MTHRWSLRRLAALTLAVIVLAAIGYLGHGRLQRRSGPIPVTVEEVQRRDIAVTIEATGTVEPIDLIEVKSKASGQILRMPVAVGSVVRAGDLLAQIDTVDVQNQYDQSQAALRAAQARAEISDAQKARSDQLFAQQVITAEEHEAAILDYANADAALVKAKTDLDTARQRRADATVRAPISGTILDQLVSTGQVISSATSSVSGGTSLLTMADLSRIRLRTLVSESDIGSVRPGQEATVSVDAFPQHPFSGVVEKVEPQAVVQQSVTMFPVLVSIGNENGLLLPGMNGEVSILVERRQGVAAVPLDAVRTLREIATVAGALGLDPDSVRARLSRQEQTGSAGRAARARPSRPEGATAGGWEGGAPPPDGGPPGGPDAGAGSPPQVERRGAARTAATRSTQAGSGGSTGRETRTQLVFIQTQAGLEPRLVRLGLSDFDYAEVLSGVSPGDQVVLLSAAELQAKRIEDQAMIRQRIGSTMPGASSAGSGTRSTRGR